MFITAAFGLVAALRGMEPSRALHIFEIRARSLRCSYAVVVTIIAVIAVILIGRAATKARRGSGSEMVPLFEIP